MMIELTVWAYSEDTGHKLLIPLDSITALRQIQNEVYVYVKGLELYVQNYMISQHNLPKIEYLDTEEIRVLNTYESLSFILQANKGTVNETNN